MPAAPAVRCADLRKVYGDVVAVNGLDLEIAVGECLGLLGPNGAGKTTSIEIMEGLTAPTSGVVELFGETWAASERSLRGRIGLTLQETRLPELLTLRELVDLFRSFYPRSRSADELLQLVGLTEKAHSRQGTLSGGQKQRLAVACGLAGDPELMFFDEPTTGLDPQSRRQLWDVITGLRTAGRSVLLTTHYMDEAERLCDRIAIVDHGRVIANDTPQRLIAEHIGGELIEVELRRDGEATLRPLVGAGASSLMVNGATIELVVDDVAVMMPKVLETARAAGIDMVRLGTRRPNLEDVFVKLTGRALRE